MNRNIDYYQVIINEEKAGGINAFVPRGILRAVSNFVPYHDSLVGGDEAKEGCLDDYDDNEDTEQEDRYLRGSEESEEEITD